MKLTTIAAGLVALGIGQITAQEIAQENETVWRNNTFAPAVGEYFDLGEDTPLTATLETTGRISVRGKERLYQCEDGQTPPNCIFRDPPADIRQCQWWRKTFHVLWGVECPPTFPTRFIYWITRRCGDGYSEIERWQLHPVGNCAHGYFDQNPNLEGISPDCAQSADLLPCATPPPCPPPPFPVTVAVNLSGICADTGDTWSGSTSFTETTAFFPTTHCEWDSQTYPFVIHISGQPDINTTTNVSMFYFQVANPPTYPAPGYYLIMPGMQVSLCPSCTLAQQRVEYLGYPGSGTHHHEYSSAGLTVSWDVSIP